MHGDTTTGRQSGLVRNLSVWQAVGLSVALMAPSMAANINPRDRAPRLRRRLSKMPMFRLNPDPAIQPGAGKAAAQ